MKDSDDIANLLKQFGGRPEEYYEIGRASEARDSQARWPLLSSIEATQGEHHPPVQPHTPGNAPAPGIGGLRARLAAPAAEPVADLRTEARVEPRLAASPDVPAPPAATTPAAPGARPAPKAQFVPPRPRGHIVPPTRPTAPLAGDLAAARLAAQAPMPAEPIDALDAPAPASPLHAAFTRPEPQRAAAAPAHAPTPGANPAPADLQPSTTPLQAIFNRLSQPKPAPERAGAVDKNASLLQRLSRL